jgi:quinol monooxygenase YgiN
MVKLVVKNLVEEDKFEEYTKLFEELAKETRKEDGCIKYELYQDEKDSKILTMIEEWENKEVLDKHMNSEHFIRIVPMLGELRTKLLDRNLYNKLI